MSTLGSITSAAGRSTLRVAGASADALLLVAAAGPKDGIHSLGVCRADGDYLDF